MADEIRVPAREMDLDATRPSAGARAGGAATNDPEVVRSRIEKTRARMSETIDEIEGVLLRKKEQIQERLDVFGVIRDRPLESLGVAFGAGLALGLLTGGDSDDAAETRVERLDPESRRRAELWERRARRLLRIAHEQEEEISRLRMRRADLSEGKPLPTEDGKEEPHPTPRASATASKFERLQDQAVTRISDFVRDSVAQLFRGGA